MNAEVREAARRVVDFRGSVRDVISVAKALLDQNPADDALPIDEAWLESIGFQEHGLSYSKLLAPVDPKAAITDMRVSPESDGSWSVSLLQSYPDEPNGHDDHVAITSKVFTTRGQLRDLLAAMGK